MQLVSLIQYNVRSRLPLPTGEGGGGGLPYETAGDARRLA